MSQKQNPRRPRAFDTEPETPRSPTDTPAEGKRRPRKPRAFEPDHSLELEAEDYFEHEGADRDTMADNGMERGRRRFSFASVVLASLALFASLSAGLWIDSIIRTLFERNLWLGWAAAGLAGILAVATAIVMLRETRAMFRLGRIDRLRGDLEEALRDTDAKALQRGTDRLIAHMASNPRSATGRKVLEQQEGEIIDAADRYSLAERELFRVADRDAFALVMGAAKRVSVVTAVSPRAFLDIAYVLFENFRLLRRLSELYGGRTGALGNLRLVRRVLTHLAVTGAASFGDGLVQQVIGHGMASRLSARLGEGVLNGLMTARVGIAAMEVCRPAPFHAASRPKLSSALSALTKGADDVRVTDKTDFNTT